MSTTPGPAGFPSETVTPAVLRSTRTLFTRRPASSAMSAWPPSCTMVTTVRATGQIRDEATAASATSAVASTSSRDGW